MGWTKRTTNDGLTSASTCPDLYIKNGYTVQGKSGKNPAILGNNKNNKQLNRPFNGCVLPNCVGYAIGRASEGCGESSCHLNSMNAYLFWQNQPSNWERSQTPSEGAIAVWGKSNTMTVGHVAVVERVINDNTITVSESGWRTWYFNYTKCTPKNRFTSLGSSFLGYLKNPYITDDTEDDKEKKWVYKSNYLNMTSADMKNNAIVFAKYVMKNYPDVTLNCIAGILGNMQKEGNIDPWSEGSGGYGLIGWTPPSVLQEHATTLKNKGITSSNNYKDGNIQTEVVINELNGTITGYWLDRTAEGGVYMPSKKFLNSTATPDYLARVYWWCREYGTLSSVPERMNNAIYWYDFLLNEGLEEPNDPNPDTGIYKKSAFKWIYYLRPIL